jgi:hypothetical protein
MHFATQPSASPSNYSDTATKDRDLLGVKSAIFAGEMCLL